MNSDRDLDLKLDQWMAGGPTDPADRLKDEAMAKVVVTPQVRGSLLQGRFTNMTAITAIAAALILAFSGAGLFLTVTDTEPAEDPLPPAQLESADVVARVSGHLDGHSVTGSGEVIFEDGRMKVLGGAYEGALSADDARLDGEATWTVNEEWLRPNLGFITTSRILVENEGGSWDGTLQGWGGPSAGLPEAWSGVLSGDGAYEGQSAYLQFSPTDDAFAFDGYVFPGEMPEAP